LKTFLIIVVMQLHGQQPAIQKIEQPDMPRCQAQARSVEKQMNSGFGACNGRSDCAPAQVTRATYVTGS
jgi:hypothetical protein